ncbi:MAG: tripartite tricarboxylate transporter TctB family protein [Nitrospinota bacterium]
MSAPEGRHPWFLRARSIDLLFALFLLVGNLLAYVFIPRLVSEPLIAETEAFTTLRPSFFPRVATLLMAALAALYLALVFREPDERLFHPPEGAAARWMVTMGVFLLYSYLLEYLGYLIATPLVLGGLTLFFGNRNVLLILLVAVGTPAFIYLFFQKFLTIALPPGILF